MGINRLSIGNDKPPNEGFDRRRMSRYDGTRPSEVRFKFGPHKGETLAQVYWSDPRYFHWMLKNSKSGFIRDMSRAYLRGLRSGQKSREVAEKVGDGAYVQPTHAEDNVPSHVPGAPAPGAGSAPRRFRGPRVKVVNGVVTTEKDLDA